MPKYADITGRRSGHLVALRYVGRRQDASYTALWSARCDCGSVIVLQGTLIATGRQKSCGCRNGVATVRRRAERQAWNDMHRRCGMPTHPSYRDYGGRGIKVCARWRSFENFLADMGKKPHRRNSLERINNDGNYSPMNCRWATPKEQAGNRRPRSGH